MTKKQKGAVMVRTSAARPKVIASRCLMIFTAIFFSLLLSKPTHAGDIAPLVFFSDHALPPYEFLEDGKPKGANVDLAHAIGISLGRPVEVRLLPWAEAQKKLLANKGFALTMLGKTEEREPYFDFSGGTLPVAFALFVRAGDEARFVTNNLDGKRIGVIGGGLPESYITSEHPKAIRVTVSDGVEGARQLLRGNIEALAANEWSQLYLLRELNISGITSLTPFVHRTGNIAVRDGDAELLAQIDGALAAIKESGEFDQIIDRWSNKRVHLFSATTIQRVIAGLVGTAFLLLLLAAIAMRLRLQKRALAREVAERRKAEQEREQLVTALRQRERDLENSDRQKDVFISTMAHELRNPLAAIKYAAEMQRVLSNAATLHSTRTVIERQVAQLVHLVDDLMDVGRITTGKVHLHKSIFNLTDAIESVVESHRARIDGAPLHLSVELPSTPLLVDGDVTRLTQVVSNLLDNAIKYSRPRGHIWVKAQHEGDTIRLIVRDDGTGIPPRMLQQIFDMFSQVDHEQGRKQDGLGIGLALVRKFVELHDGTVTAYSDGEGMGASVVVTLPAAADADGNAMSGNQSIQPVATQARPLRLVIVEDNVDNAQSLKLLLEDIQYEVVIAHDGLQGIELAEKLCPDALIIDIGLPDMSGYEVARIVRGSVWGSTTPLIALTGWGQESDREKSRKAGFDRHFTKPVSLVELQSALDELIKQEKIPATI